MNDWLEKRLFDGRQDQLTPIIRMKVGFSSYHDDQAIVDKMLSISPQQCHKQTMESLESFKSILTKYLKRTPLTEEEWQSDVAIELKTLVPSNSWILRDDSFSKKFLALCKDRLKHTIVCTLMVW